MSIKAVFFDLDGTLLPMDQDVFIQDYFSRIARYMIPYGFDPKGLIDSIWKCTVGMIKNGGEVTNETKFWNGFCEIYGENARQYEPVFEKFYVDEFDKVKSSVGFSPESAKLVRALKERGIALILATNPIFPSIATEKRILWAGLDVGDFAHVTVYENSFFAKPNLAYYRSILDRFGLSAQECVMVGNDVGEDMVAEQLGMHVFLHTDCLINKRGIDISAYPRGSFRELSEYLYSLI